MALTYADFYFQFKSTGFGNCLHAAQCLVQKLNLPLSGQGFPQFVSVVKEVRNEIVEKNPRNRLTPSEFESAFAGWLWQERFRFEPVKCSPQENPSVNVITAKASPLRVCSSDDSVVTDLLQQHPSNGQHSIDPDLAPSTDESGYSTLDQPVTLPSTTDQHYNSSLDLKPSLTIHFPPEPVNHAPNQTDAEAAQAQIVASPPSSDQFLWPLCSSHEGQVPVTVEQPVPDSVVRELPVTVEQSVSDSVERQLPVSIDTLITTKKKFDNSISTKKETCEEKVRGHENAAIQEEEDVDSEQVMLEKAWIKKLKNDLREKLGGKVGKGKPIKEKAPPLTKEERERQRLEAKLIRQAERERIKMEEKLKKQQEREKRREEEEMLKREEKARKRLARQEKKEKKMAEEKAERLRKKQVRMERKEAKIAVAKLKRQEAKENRQDNEVRQAAIQGQQRIRTALTGQEGEEDTYEEGNWSRDKKPFPLVASVCEGERDKRLQQDQVEMQREEREKRQEERLKKQCEIKPEQLNKEPKSAANRMKTGLEQMEEEACWPMEGSLSTRRKTRGSTKTFKDVAADGGPEQMGSCSDDDGDDLDVCWEAGESRLRGRTHKKPPKFPRPNITPDEDGKFPCQAEGCDSKFVVFRSAVVHMQNRHQLHLFSCSDCEEKFKVADLLSYHRDVVHGCADNEAFKCQVCASCFSNEDNLNRHNTLEHVPGIIQCLFCDRKFHYSEDRNKHIIADHAGLVFPCKACSKFFRQDSAALAHFKTLHPDQIINCSGCKREFAAQRSLRYHIETAHSTLIEWETPFQCEVVRCRLRWSTQENLDRHMLSKHRKATSQRWNRNPDPAPERYPEVACDTCGYFISQFQLVRQMGKQECDKLHANLRQHMMAVHMFSAEGNDGAQEVSVAPVCSPAAQMPPPEKSETNRVPEWEKSDGEDEGNDDEEDDDEEEEEMESEEDGESYDLDDFSIDEDDFDEMEEGEEMEDDDEEMEEEENVDKREDDETEEDDNVEADEGDESGRVKAGIDVEGKTDEAIGRKEDTLKEHDRDAV